MLGNRGEDAMEGTLADALAGFVVLVENAADGMALVVVDFAGYYCALSEMELGYVVHDVGGGLLGGLLLLLLLLLNGLLGGARGMMRDREGKGFGVWKRL